MILLAWLDEEHNKLGEPDSWQIRQLLGGWPGPFVTSVGNLFVLTLEFNDAKTSRTSFRSFCKSFFFVQNFLWWGTHGIFTEIDSRYHFFLGLNLKHSRLALWTVPTDLKFYIWETISVCLHPWVLWPRKRHWLVLEDLHLNYLLT